MQITVNEPGARTIRDAKAMIIDGQRVYVTVGETTASLHVAGRIAAERPAGEIVTAKDAQDWAVAYRTAMNEWADEQQAAAQDHMVVDWAAVEDATNADAVYAAAVDQVHAKADELLADADKLEEHGWKPLWKKNTRGRRISILSSDPRHPMNAAKSLRKDAEILAAWTGLDEQGYSRYVSDGIGDTDGWFVPEDRAAWKAHQPVAAADFVAADGTVWPTA
jgi:hypothetical protein